MDYPTLNYLVLTQEDIYKLPTDVRIALRGIIARVEENRKKTNDHPTFYRVMQTRLCTSSPELIIKPQLYGCSTTNVDIEVRSVAEGMNPRVVPTQQGERHMLPIIGFSPDGTAGVISTITVEAKSKTIDRDGIKYVRRIFSYRGYGMHLLVHAQNAEAHIPRSVIMRYALRIKED